MFYQSAVPHYGTFATRKVPVGPADVTQRDVRIRLIDCFVNAVYEYDDKKVVVTLNYKDGTAVIRSNEVDAVFGSTMNMVGEPIYTANRAADMKKKTGKTERSEQRVQKARQWILTYEGTKIVRAYRKRFHVDTTCALRELGEIGYPFPPGYVENLKKAEAARLEQLRAKREEKAAEWQGSDFQNDMFYFIAGHTPGGAPYGVTWEQMGLEPYEDEMELEDGAVCYRHYEHLPQWEKDALDSKLREAFSAFVTERRRFPGRNQRDAMIARVFEGASGGPVLHTEDFNRTYRKIVRKRENAFIREGVLPKRFSATELRAYYERSVMLESGRLLFRKLTAEDFSDLAEMLRDPKVMYAWGHTFSDEQIQKWIDAQILRYRDHIVGYFAVICKDTGAFHIHKRRLRQRDAGNRRRRCERCFQAPVQRLLLQGPFPEGEKRLSHEMGIG